MEINILELRKAPIINWQVPYKWMSKLKNEDIERWESELITEIKASISAEGREIKNEEIVFRVQKEASFLEREYDLNMSGLT